MILTDRIEVIAILSIESTLILWFPEELSSIGRIDFTKTLLFSEDISPVPDISILFLRSREIHPGACKVFVIEGYPFIDFIGLPEGQLGGRSVHVALKTGLGDWLFLVLISGV